MNDEDFAAFAAEFNARRASDRGSSVHMSFEGFGKTPLKELTRQMASEAREHRAAMFAAAVDSHAGRRKHEEKVKREKEQVCGCARCRRWCVGSDTVCLVSHARCLHVTRTDTPCRPPRRRNLPALLHLLTMAACARQPTVF